MVLKATANDKRHLAICHDEFRGPLSDLCRSGGIRNKAAFVKIMEGGSKLRQPRHCLTVTHERLCRETDARDEISEMGKRVT
ncbi:hypothetical protein TNCV_1932811 [Trichonephila clavipes]|nr:hypothetical protein TNCV_1932811 [Trichonephila clavipes]